MRLFEITVLRRIFGRNMEEVAGGWRTPHSEEVRNLCASQNTIRAIKSSRMMWAGHVARIRNEKCLQNVGRKI